MALLRCHGNSVCHIFTHADIVNAQTWESSSPKKSSQATLHRFRSVKCSNRVMSWNAWGISTAFFPVLHVF